MTTDAEAGQAGGQVQTRRFLLLYALAVAGGAVAYVPFLTILLPVRVEGMAGGESVAWLAYIAFAGAIAASLANIAFGWLSDITGNRRGWILAGLILSSTMLVVLSSARSLPMLIGMLVAWQLALNMMLGPLAAWAGDVVPDRQKGTLGGLLAFAPALGAMSGAMVTIPGLAEADVRMVLVAGLVVACVLPVLLFGRPVPFAELTTPNYAPAQQMRDPRRIVARMWIARLLVQVAEAALFAYLYLWLRSISPEIGDNDAAQVFGIVLLVAVPVTLWTGRWADRHDRPIFPLAIAAAVSSAALLVMALAPGITVALIGYAIFGLAAGVFLALHSAQTLRVLPRPQNRGRDLGLFNLTNTTPSLIMPGLTLAMVPAFDFAGLFIVLAVLAGLACLLLMSAQRAK
ncbi:MFS transporter [Erythrobacter alti]|uniref:MFS transporter n=1 Tax=Erythrobacter alti TaxID=1896145 RepID=UPI0030F3A3C8